MVMWQSEGLLRVCCDKERHCNEFRDDKRKKVVTDGRIFGLLGSQGRNQMKRTNQFFDGVFIHCVFFSKALCREF